MIAAEFVNLLHYLHVAVQFTLLAPKVCVLARFPVARRYRGLVIPILEKFVNSKFSLIFWVLVVNGPVEEKR